MLQFSLRDDYDENDDIAWDTPVADFVMSDGAPVEGGGGQNKHHHIQNVVNGTDRQSSPKNGTDFSKKVLRLAEKSWSNWAKNLRILRGCFAACAAREFSPVL